MHPGNVGIYHVASCIEFQSPLLAPFLKFSLKPCRIATHRQERYYVGNFSYNFVVNRVGESLGKHPVETVFSYVNACVDNQGLNISNQTIPKVFTDTGFSFWQD